MFQMAYLGDQLLLRLCLVENGWGSYWVGKMTRHSLCFVEFVRPVFKYVLGEFAYLK